MPTTPEQNKPLVLEAFDTLFNKRRLCDRRTILVAGLHSIQRPYRTRS